MTLQNTGWSQINGLHLDNILAKRLQDPQFWTYRQLSDLMVRATAMMFDLPYIAYYLIEEQMEKKSSPDGHIFFVRLLGDLRYCGISGGATLATNANIGKKFEWWINEEKSPAVPGVLRLYQTLLDLGIKPIFITDTKEEFRQVRMANLKKAGYHSWFQVHLPGKK
ncbi:uncharacterized protein LOC124891838 [Capsicum annuum]|uniref:uncharacterized protein LOC124891838 n=1 Tax=Capsicum annuum TaxID=4072 RepID=UPI001FB08FBE|nr:uncharacterized protein LOC124891838 [Capsicum annuum]